MTTKVRKGKRVTIKVDAATFTTLRNLRKRTGLPITHIMAGAAGTWAMAKGLRRPGRPRKLRGSR